MEEDSVPAISIIDFMQNMSRPQLNRLPDESLYVNVVLDLCVQSIEMVTNQKLEVVKYSKQ